MPTHDEQYTIRQKFFKIFGAGFHIYDGEGNLAGYCKQKAFKLREDLRIYTDEGMGTELIRIGTRSIIDFGAAYEVSLPTGESLGTVRRKGMKSFVRDSWMVFAPAGEQIATIEEDSQGKAIFRRVLGDYAFLMPQRFHLRTMEGEELAVYRTHFNIVVHKLGVRILREHPELDDLMVLAVGILLSAIEGRQG